MELTQEVAAKVLEVVDAGLCNGAGQPIPGKMCVEAAVCFALGLPHGDTPPCVGSAVRRFKIRLNDARWPSDTARAAGMRKLAVAQLGSDTINQLDFAKAVTMKTIQRILPHTLRLLAKRLPTRAEEFERLSVDCENATDLPSAGVAARAAQRAAAAYAAYADAAYAARHEVLLMSAQIGLEALIECGSPGCQWLSLCDLEPVGAP